MKLHSGLKWKCWLLVLTAGVSEARAGVIYNSLDTHPNPAVYVDPSPGYGPLADSFSTGGQNVILNDVKVKLLFVGNIAATVSADLTDDNPSTTTPGATLYHIGDIAAINFNQEYAILDFSNLSYQLSANHRYWIELSGTLHGSAWPYTQVAYGIGVAGEFHYYGHYGQSFSNDEVGGAVFEMQVSAGDVPTVAAVPEPSTLVSACLGGLMWLGSAWRNRRRATA